MSTTMDLSSTDLPAIGETNRNAFWIVLLVALLALTGMMTLVSRGAIAVAAAIPVTLVVKGDILQGSNFHLYPGVSQADNAAPVAIVQMDTTITNHRIIKTFNVPVIGDITLTLSAGAGA